MASRYEESKTIMLEILIAGRENNHAPGQIAKAINAAYPFGERKRYPYKAWLRALRDFSAQHGLPRRTSRPPAPDLTSANEPLGKNAPRVADVAFHRCKIGHWFSTLPNHPVRDGALACPQCMANALALL